MSRLLTLTQAANELNISPHTLRNLCDAGYVAGERDSRGYRVFRAEVIASERLRRLVKKSRGGPRRL